MVAEAPETPVWPPPISSSPDGHAPETYSLRPPLSLGRMLGYGLLCGLVGFLVSLRAFAAATLPHILTPDGYNFQGVQEGMPVPRLIDWDPTRIGLLQQYTTLHPLLLSIGGLLVFGLLWTRTLTLLFPALRLLRPYSPPDTVGPSAGARTTAVALDGRMLSRSGWLFILVATPLLVTGYVETVAAGRFPRQAGMLQCVAFIAAGLWIRFTLRPTGMVERSIFPTVLASSRKGRSALGSELSVAVLFGIMLFSLQRNAMQLPAADVLRSLHALGLFDVPRWNALAIHYLLSAILVCFAAGIVFMLLISLPTRPQTKPWPLALALLCMAVTAQLQRPYSSKALADNWDITPTIMLATFPYTPRNPTSGVPDGIEAGKALAHNAGLPSGPASIPPDHRFLLFTHGGTFIGVQHGYTEDGLTTDPATVPKVKAYLERHDYNTALSWTAFKHQFNIGNVHFDSTLALRACLDDLERSPHAVVIPTVREMLFTVAATPQNLALLNEWADDRRFDAADRATVKLMGDLYLRFGEQRKALEWYARADMPHSFMEGVRSHKPLFHAGVIQGAVLWNGKPLAGVQVGAFPFLQNGLPKDLEPQVRGAERGLLPPYSYSDGFGPMEPRPYQFRWMSAGTVTDANGHFTMDHLTEGTYHLVCTLPADTGLKPFQDDRLLAIHPPGDITVRYPKPIADLGTIELTFHP